MNLKVTSVIIAQRKFRRSSLFLLSFSRFLSLSFSPLRDAINAKLKPSRILARYKYSVAQIPERLSRKSQYFPLQLRLPRGSMWVGSCFI